MVLHPEKTQVSMGEGEGLQSRSPIQSVEPRVGSFALLGFLHGWVCSHNRKTGAMFWRARLRASAKSGIERNWLRLRLR